MALLALAGLLACGLSLCSPLHKPTRRLLAPSLRSITIKQLPLVAATQGYCSRWLDWAVLLSAATITIEVYLTLLPMLMWSGNDHFAVCGLLPQLALAGYVVFAIKDLLESPRPADCLKLVSNAHIVVRDPSGDIEDGVPSAHCCGAVSMLFYVINTAAAAGLLSPAAKPLAQAAAVVWVAWLAWGRAYLGLHTPLDLATGSLLGWALIELWARLEGPYQAWLAASLAAPAWQLAAQVLAASAVLMRCYPMPRRWTSCYNYATAWAAGWAGATLGWAALYRQPGGGSTVGSTAPSVALLGGAMVPSIVPKILLGLGLVVAAKVVTKAVLLLALKQLFALVPLPVRCLWQPPIVGAPARQQQQPQQPKELQQAAADGKRTAAQAGAGCEADVGAARDAAAKQQGSNGLVPGKAGGTAAAPDTAGCSSGNSSSIGVAESGGLWCLRHSFDGLPNDVVATARWGSYFAVGYAIMAWQRWWPVLVASVAPPASSLS